MLRKIKGYRGKYKVSDRGYVINTFTNKKVAMFSDSNSYIKLTLQIKGVKNKQKKISRLVAEYFIPNPDNKPEVNHKDGDKSNNKATNLEWVTSSENKYHAYETGLRGRIKVDQYTLNHKFVKTWPSVKAICEELGIGQQHISKCLRDYNKTGYGYRWKYATGSFFKQPRFKTPEYVMARVLELKLNKDGHTIARK